MCALPFLAMQWKQCTHALTPLAQPMMWDSSSSLLEAPGTLCHAIAKFLTLHALQVFMFLFDRSGKLLHANQQALYHYCGASGMLHCCAPVYNQTHMLIGLTTHCTQLVPSAQACIPCLCLSSCAVGTCPQIANDSRRQMAKLCNCKQLLQ